MHFTRIWAPLALLATVGAGVGADSAAQTSPPLDPHRDQGRHAPATLHVAVVQAFVCDGVLVTVSNLESLQERQWQFTQDDGREDIQVRHLDGAWTSVGSTSGGEAHRRWVGYAQTRDLAGLARIIRTDGTGIISTPHLIDECPFPSR